MKSAKTFPYKSGDWELDCLPDDGARLRRLSFKGIELLTEYPGNFRSPAKDFGLYETRPVYGYDDCFPTVDSCKYPGLDWRIPDHGELCWKKWEVSEAEKSIEFSVTSEKVPICFTRKMLFEDNILRWRFSALNKGMQNLPFLHVMHPLMPLDAVKSFSLPEFSSVYDETEKGEILLTPLEIKKLLLELPPGKFKMLILRNIDSGSFSLEFKNELKLQVDFPHELFPSLGVWWNNSAYPDETGGRRCECAFEPIPGTCSSLAKAWDDKSCMNVGASESFDWEIIWTVNI